MHACRGRSIADRNGPRTPNADDGGAAPPESARGLGGGSGSDQRNLREGIHARQTARVLVPSCTGRGVHVCSTSRFPQPHGALPPLQEIRSVHPYTLLADPAMKQKARQAFNGLDVRWDRAKSKSAASVLGPLAVCPPDSLPVRSPSRRGTPPHPKPSLIMHVCANTTLGLYSYRS